MPPVRRCLAALSGAPVLGASLLLLGCSGAREAGAAAAGAAAAAERYVCPMHPDIVRAGPADCPICGMDLVPSRQQADPAPPPEGAGEVRIAPEVVNSLGVRLARVERRALRQRIETIGYVEYDRTRLRHVYPLSEGAIQRITVSSEGERVRRGQFLFQLFSPMLSRPKDETYAESDGIVVALNVIEGQWVGPDQPAITLGDLATVWVLAEVFEGQAAWVRVGQPVEVRLAYVPQRTWKGRIHYVYPNLDAETRTLKVRIVVGNRDEVLKPNMHAEVSIDCGERRGVLAVPSEALIETGSERRVILALDGGRFLPRVVSAGTESEGWVEISEGLAEGERVVISAQFLIDSEASLRASFARMSEEDPPPPRSRD